MLRNKSAIGRVRNATRPTERFANWALWNIRWQMGVDCNTPSSLRSLRDFCLPKPTVEQREPDLERLFSCDPPW